MAIALGHSTAFQFQGAEAIAIGRNAGFDEQKAYAIAIGSGAGNSFQSTFGIAIGYNAGAENQRDDAIAIGFLAASTSQGSESIAIGTRAGLDGQNPSSIAIGFEAGYTSQGPNTVAIGTRTGYNSMGDSSIAIGKEAGYTTYVGTVYDIGNDSVLIGTNAGRYIAESNVVAIGTNIGSTTYTGPPLTGGLTTPYGVIEPNSVTIGADAAIYGANQNAITIGFNAGSAYTSQSGSTFAGTWGGSICIGANSFAQGGSGGDPNFDGAIAIGNRAAVAGAGCGNTIAIGHNVRVENSGGGGSGSEGLFIAPIRGAGTIVAGTPTPYIDNNYILWYNRDNPDQSYEVCYAPMEMYNKRLYMSWSECDGECGIYGITISTDPWPNPPAPGEGRTDCALGTFKTFVIDHPTKSDNYLVHTCLEGPEAGVYYRGTATVCDRFVEVELPDYVDALAKDFTINVTHIFDEDVDEEPKTYSATKIKDGKFKIYGPKGNVSWLVMGARGYIEVEPKKSSVSVKGDGPYKYI